MSLFGSVHKADKKDKTDRSDRADKKDRSDKIGSDKKDKTDRTDRTDRTERKKDKERSDKIVDKYEKGKQKESERDRKKEPEKERKKELERKKSERKDSEHRDRKNKKDQKEQKESEKESKKESERKESERVEHKKESKRKELERVEQEKEQRESEESDSSLEEIIQDDIVQISDSNEYDNENISDVETFGFIFIYEANGVFYRNINDIDKADGRMVVIHPVHYDEYNNNMQSEEVVYDQEKDKYISGSSDGTWLDVLYGYPENLFYMDLNTIVFYDGYYYHCNDCLVNKLTDNGTAKINLL